MICPQDPVKKVNINLVYTFAPNRPQIIVWGLYWLYSIHRDCEWSQEPAKVQSWAISHLAVILYLVQQLRLGHN